MEIRYEYLISDTGLCVLTHFTYSQPAQEERTLLLSVTGNPVTFPSRSIPAHIVDSLQIYAPVPYSYDYRFYRRPFAAGHNRLGLDWGLVSGLRRTSSKSIHEFLFINVPPY